MKLVVQEVIRMNEQDKTEEKKPLSEAVWEDFERAFGLIAEATSNELG